MAQAQICAKNRSWVWTPDADFFACSLFLVIENVSVLWVSSTEGPGLLPHLCGNFLRRFLLLFPRVRRWSSYLSIFPLISVVLMQTSLLGLKAIRGERISIWFWSPCHDTAGHWCSCIDSAEFIRNLEWKAWLFSLNVAFHQLSSSTWDFKSLRLGCCVSLRAACVGIADAVWRADEISRAYEAYVWTAYRI